MSRDLIRDYLQSIGYQVRFREGEWAECLILGEGATWLGGGADASAAFDAAVTLLCPSPLAKRLLADAAAKRSLDPAAEHSQPPAPLDSVPPPSPNEMSVSKRFEEAAARSRTNVERPAPGQIAVILSRPVTPRPGVLPEAASIEPAARAENEPPPLLISSAPASPLSAPLSDHGPLWDPPLITVPEESLEALDILLDRVRDSREELGLCSPERQRLVMLCWICEARSHTDTFPDDPRVRDRVGAISRLLTEIGKTFWPGSVTALQLHMQPRDLPRHLIGGTATTWHRAAELAEQSLRMRELEDERRGFDAYGWADAKALSPRPMEPQRVLDTLIAEVEQVSGSVTTQAPPPDSSVRPDATAFVRWVRQLRWLRGWEVDPDLWARLAGRFRWWAFRREPALTAAARELEAGFAPAQSWAGLLGQDPELRRTQRRLRELLERPPELEGPEARQTLVNWLASTLPFGDTHHGNIVHLMQPYRELVMELTPEVLPESDRRLRRRLVRLQEDLQAANGQVRLAPLPDLEGGPEAEVEAAANSEPPSLPEALLSKVRVLTRDKRSVLVSQRRDPELLATLQETFGFASFDCKIAEARRARALGEAIEDEQYDVVLLATGFQLPALDYTLARACRAAGVLYVRVHCPGTHSLLRALARDLAGRLPSA